MQTKANETERTGKVSVNLRVGIKHMPGMIASVGISVEKLEDIKMPQAMPQRPQQKYISWYGNLKTFLQ